MCVEVAPCGRWCEGDASRAFAQVGAAASGPGHDLFGAAFAGEFKNEDAVVAAGGQLLEKNGPIDTTVAGR